MSENTDDYDQDCGCRVHPRYCAWNGPCCDDCTHEPEEAHAECCAPTTRPHAAATSVAGEVRA